MRRAPLPLVCVLVCATLAASCGGRPAEEEAASAADTLTRGERDSIIAGSRLPGARVVGRALDAAERANARTRLEDSLAASPR
jgi:hypothetical protein